MQDVINFNLLKEYDSALKDVLGVWQKENAYSLGDKVKYKGHLLECTTAGTSGTTTLNFTNLDIGDTITDGTVVWELVEEESGKGIDFYTVGESYEVGDIVIYSGNIYQCITAHTATSTFDTTKWEEVSKSGVPYYNSSTSYKINDQVVYNNKIYKCITAHTSTSTFDSAKWEEISSGGGISIWQANTDYAVDDVVIDSNLIWQCATAHTSSTTFDESKWICLSGGEISNGMEIVTLWEGKYNISNESSSSITNTITLEDSVENYKLLLVQMYAYDTSGDRYLKGNILTIDTSYITYNNSYSFISNFYANSSNNASLEYMFKDSLNMGIAWKNSTGSDAPYITKVQGIRKAKPIVSSGMKYETLWEGEVGSLTSDYNTNLQLSTTINKYSKLGFELKTCNPANTNDIKIYYQECSVSQIISLINGGSGNILFTAGYGTWTNNFNIYSTSTPSNLVVELSKNVLTKVIGISEGVQIPTGVQAARVTLWEGFYNTLNSVQTLSDNIKNYDQFEVTYANNGTGEFQTRLFNVSDINNFSGTFHCDGFASWGNPPYYFVLTFDFVSETTWKLDSVQGNGWNFGITKITGIKYIQPDSYSTEEKLIGTWIDGKPLYRKVFENVNDGYNTGLNKNDYNIIKIDGIIYDGANNSQMIPGKNEDVYITSNGILRSEFGASIRYFIVEYTKN